MKVENPLQYPGWDDLLATNPAGSFFHTTNWARVLSECYQYTPHYFVAMNGTLATLIPIMEVSSRLTGKRGVSLPFTDYSAPIFDAGADPRLALGLMVDHGKTAGWAYLEFRDAAPFLSGFPAASTYCGHVLDLSGGEEKVHSALGDSTKRNIRKALRKGVTVRRLETEASVREFYRLNCLTRRSHGLPPQPYRFFLKVLEHVISKGLGLVFLAYHNDVAIAGNVYFHHGQGAIFKYGASDKAYQHLRASNLVMWEAIRWYCRHGYRSLCFGRTELENHGLMRYKFGWGTTERTIKYYRYDFRTRGFVGANPSPPAICAKLFKILPIGISKAVGNGLYRHMA